MKVAVVERGLVGGTCVNTGCTPTKTMVASAYTAHLARRAADFGVVLDGPVRVDMKQVKARKDAVSGASRRSLEQWLRNMPNCTFYEGSARFQSPQEVAVGPPAWSPAFRRPELGTRAISPNGGPVPPEGGTPYPGPATVLTASRIFLNVGTRPRFPAMPGLDQVDYLTNSSIMDLDFLPAHLLIVGGSYVGLEFGQMFRRFGSEVTIIEMGPRLLSREDEDVSIAIQEILEREGIHLRLNAECISAGSAGVSPASCAGQKSQISIGLGCQAGAPSVTGTHLLLAVGRTPNIDDLGLELAGVAQDKHGYIVVDDQLRTSVPGIWALGDCNGKGAFTHTAYNDFEIVAANLIDNQPRRVSDRIQAYALYIDPPLGRAGLTDAQVRAAGKPALSAKRPMTRVARAIEKGETQGFMKVVVDRDSKQILGAAILGPGGDEAVHCILDVMYAKAPYTVLQRAMHIHPTVSELIPTLLQDLKPLEAHQ
jgi:pyruvate/2-oxoglutarate dehydrogenase complex dihydrolipoamide dehydrogenase (E3) component